MEAQGNGDGARLELHPWYIGMDEQVHNVGLVFDPAGETVAEIKFVPDHIWTELVSSLQ